MPHAPAVLPSHPRLPLRRVGRGAAANFIWREPETIACEPWYHHPYDTFERVSEARLRTVLSIVPGASLEVICRAPEQAELLS
jgi:hypothetical protein